MKLGALFTSVSLVSSALAFTISGRDLPTNNDCRGLALTSGYHKNATHQGSYSAACSFLNYDCMQKAKTTTSIWSKTSCVAAAICESPHSIVQYARCPGTNPSIPDRNVTGALSTNIYNEIVAPSGCSGTACPITGQNVVDLIYRQLTAINSTAWPSSPENVLAEWWAPIEAWMSVSRYQDFNDWLHYAQ